ncbi:MAG: hypothetical protein NTV00_06640, partial [Methylococcales bacterium]|nr:hypothetical protein [Methylococcales bacterium]
RQDSLALFKNDNDAAYQIQRYQAVVNAQNGLPEANWIVDLDYLTAEELRDRQAALRLRHTKHELSLVESYLQQQQEALDNAAAKTKQRVDPSEPDKASTPSWLK